MSESTTLPAGEGHGAVDGAHEVTRTLREARERAGLHIVAMAAMLKVPVARLEALEEGRFHDLPDMTFARALASSMCRVLKVDAAPILAQFPASQSVRLAQSVGTLNQPMPVRSDPVLAKPGDGRRTALTWPVALALVLVFAAAVLYVVLPQRDTSVGDAESGPSASLVESPVAPPPPAAAPGDSIAGGVAEQGSGAASNGNSPVEDSAQGAGALSSTDSLATGVAAQPTASTPAAAEAPRDTASAVLSLQARESSWVQVTGASGRVLLQRNLGAGEMVQFEQDAPLAVVVGRVDAVTVRVRGAVFDLQAVARNNVARFEVK